MPLQISVRSSGPGVHCPGAWGAVRIRFPEDRSRDEKETFSWVVLKPVDFNREVHLGWRFDAAQLAKERAH